jgi:hypothetical protein
MHEKPKRPSINELYEIARKHNEATRRRETVAKAAANPSKREKLAEGALKTVVGVVGVPATVVFWVIVICLGPGIIGLLLWGRFIFSAG